MDTDPNPFRESPDSDRASSSTEAPDDSARDFAEATESPDREPAASKPAEEPEEGEGEQPVEEPISVEQPAVGGDAPGEAGH